MRRQLNAPTCGSASWSDTRPQTETETPNASLANELRMSANCRPDISRRAAITPHDGIRITAAHNAFPATFTDQENNGYLDSILTANSPDALRTLCEQRSMEENKRWRNWWNLPQIRVMTCQQMQNTPAFFIEVSFIGLTESELHQIRRWVIANSRNSQPA